MEYVDLHVHSTASDGTFTPKEVVQLAAKQNLYAIALTDHDTIDGVYEALETSKELESEGKLIEIIPGTELSVAYKGRDIHMLGLFLDPYNEDLKRNLNLARDNRNERNIKMAHNLTTIGFDISVEQLKEMAGDAVLTRAHFAKYLLLKGYVSSMKEAFDKYLGDDSPYYVKRDYMTPQRGIELIHNAGGIAILAHPLLYKYSLKEVEELIDTLYEYGLDGVEIIHSTNTGFDEGHLRRLANKHDLLYSGGSDFHGTNKPNISIGVGYGNLKIKKELYDRLKEYLPKVQQNK